jgi:predicted Zn finger-like uncharacterized protein
MQIVCPHCKTAYEVDPSSVGVAGRSVRCARCRTVWFATDSAALSQIAAAHRAEMTQFAATAPDPHEASQWLEPEGAATDTGRADFGFVHDAPPLAADSAGSDMAPASQMPVVESPALAPTESGFAATSRAPAADIETVAAQRAREQARHWGLRLPGWPTALLGLILLDLGLIGWRADIVRMAPQTASLYAAFGLPVNLRGLVLANVVSETQTVDGVQVLQLQGEIVSAAKRTVAVPRLRFAVRNGSGNEIYSWTALPARSLLSPGETLAFQSRLASPPPETHDVLVRFFNRHDLGIGNE